MVEELASIFIIISPFLFFIFVTTRNFRFYSSDCDELAGDSELPGPPDPAARRMRKAPVVRRCLWQVGPGQGSNLKSSRVPARRSLGSVPPQKQERGSFLSPRRNHINGGDSLRQVPDLTRRLPLPTRARLGGKTCEWVTVDGVWIRDVSDETESKAVDTVQIGLKLDPAQ